MLCSLHISIFMYIMEMYENVCICSLYCIYAQTSLQLRTFKPETLTFMSMIFVSYLFVTMFVIVFGLPEPSIHHLLYKEVHGQIDICVVDAFQHQSNVTHWFLPTEGFQDRLHTFIWQGSILHAAMHLLHWFTKC